ncbi:mannose-1-phosphate guanylyltransferase/mannose-6-phosphate isomerase [Porticoccaceae bacterium]|nr:mannose-1-phosphate guanylyltransferase/mannose-6-phosphate isomerase [Porticoccaceae bacterium]
MSRLHAVVLAGGSGTRLWPLSRSSHPKQFIPLYDDVTLLQATMQRALLLDCYALSVVCNTEHRFLLAEQLREIESTASIILEPAARDTAPAVALAALAALAKDEDPVLLVLAADHLIQHQANFVDTIKSSVCLAESGKLVTYGVVPDSANVDYGYIKFGKPCPQGYEVDRFIEKPCAPDAQAFYEAGGYLWNSGMFLFKASRYLQELKKYRPAMYRLCVAAFEKAEVDWDFLRVYEHDFSACVAESVDYAVMEHTHDAVTVPLDCGWSDIGSWSALWSVSDKDESGNVARGDVVMHKVTNSQVVADDKLVAVLGVDDLVVVNSADAVLVAHKNSLNDLKQLVKQLEAENRDEVRVHPKVYRPWGFYQLVDRGAEYQVKRISVRPGAKLSLQKHNHRAEHWVVVSGVATVERDNKRFKLAKNESTFIPIGAVHSLENNEDELLQIIEVQSGDYLGEDDIIRYSDHYGRA